MADRTRIRRAVAASALVTAVLVSGCASVPTSGPVHVGRAVPAAGGSTQDGIRVLPAPPQPGMSQVALVDGFLRATVDADDDYSAARAFLAPGAAWNTSAGTTLYNQAGLLLIRVGTTGVEMRAPAVGTISKRGDYTAAPGNLVRRFTMVRQAGQWRISRPPPGVLLATVDAQRSLELESVYYLNPSGDALVPDQILVAPEQPGTATTLMRALLSGPPAPLSSALTTALPAGTRLLGNVPVGSNGVAQVDLSVLLHPISTQTLRRLSAQIVWTLTQLPNVTAVQLLVDGDALLAPGFPTLQTTKIWAAFDPAAAPYPRGVLYVRHGRVRSIGGPVPPALAHRSRLRSPVLGDDGTAVAALRRRGTETQLLMGSSTGGLRVRLTAPGLSAPSFDRSGDVVLAEQSAVGSQVIEVPEAGKPRVVGAPESVLSQGIADLAVAPDGTQVALTVGPPGARSLMIGLLDRRRSVPALVAVHTVLPSTADAGGLAWNGSDGVLTTTVESARDRTVTESDTVGYNPHPLSPTPLPGRPVLVAAAAGQRKYAVAGHTLLRLDGTTWQRVSTGLDPAYAD